jgi:hypothetical protein
VKAKSPARELKERKPTVFSSLSDRLEFSFKNLKAAEKKSNNLEVNGEKSVEPEKPSAEKIKEEIVVSPVKQEPEASPKVEVESPQTLNKSPEKLKIEMKIERKKSPRRIEKPKVNIFLQDSDEVDEFESIPLEIKSKWSSPRFPLISENKIPQIVPAPLPFVELKRSILNAPVVIESPEKSPVAPVPASKNVFDSSLMTVEKSPTPSPPPQKARVRNVCSFLSDIASGNMFSGLGMSSSMYDDEEEKSIGGLNLDNYKPSTSVKAPEERRKIELKLDIESIMEPDTTVDKIAEKTRVTSDSDSDSDSDDSDTSSSSDSDDTTSESEESSDSSSDDDVPSFTRGFGRFDASSMPMVTQIKPIVAPSTTITTPIAVTVASRFQPQQSVIKPPGLLTSVNKSNFYTPPGLGGIPSITTPFTIPIPGGPILPIPFKIYSLRDATNCQITFPSPVQPVPVTPTPTVEQADSEKDKKTSERDRRDKDRKRSRSHSRERDKKRDDRRKSSPSRRRSPSPAKKRHSDDRGRQLEERKDSRRRESSPRHGSHSSRTSHASR